MTFSERLEMAMKESGHTQGSLAKAVGMAQSSVWKLVSGGAQGSRKLVDIAIWNLSLYIHISIYVRR